MSDYVWYMCKRDGHVTVAYDQAPKCAICWRYYRSYMVRLPEYVQAAGKIGGSETVREMAWQIWVEGNG